MQTTTQQQRNSGESSRVSQQQRAAIFFDGDLEKALSKNRVQSTFFYSTQFHTQRIQEKTKKQIKIKSS